MLLDVVDESHRHSVPSGAESHFNLTVVCAAFDGMMRIDRHRRIHELLQAELDGGLHALTLTLLSPSEYEAKRAKGEVGIASPNCLGGSKKG